MSALTRLGIAATAASSATPTRSAEQRQTEETFGYKWARRDTYESQAAKDHARQWLFERYCGGDECLLDRWLEGEPKLILDAGCGSGFTGLLFFGDRLKRHDYLGADISTAVNVARERFSESGIPGDFLQCDLMHLPIPKEALDMIYSEGVLHHTDNTRDAIMALASLLKPGGRFLFYVYAKKGPIREFTDDYIRDKIKDMDDDAAWEALEPLTKLGQTLGGIDIEVNVPEEIEILGIPKGKIPLQRLFYWHVCKMFYRPEFSLNEMNHINFDWFRPSNCHRQTPEEVRCFCEDADLDIETMNVQDAGITVVAVRR